MAPVPTSNPTSAAVWSFLPRSRWALVFATWSVPALLSVVETTVFWRMGGRDFPIWRAVASEAPAWFVYALFTPAIFALGRRFPLRAPLLPLKFAFHLFAALVAGSAYALTAVAASALFSPFNSNMTVVRRFLGWFLSGLPLMVLAYFGVLGVGYALAYFAESRRRELESARLSTQLAEARLGALRMQLHPHFLFNSLNAISVLARDGDTSGVTRMLERLSGLLREVLRSDAGHEVPLTEEIDFVRRYLDVERVRFQDRLRVHFAIDAAAEKALVPRFVLQPLVENALRHGIGRRRDAGNLEIGARAPNEHSVELWVADDGAGLPTDWDDDDGFGVGLTNTIARLEELHGASATLSLTPAPGGGTIARVRLPFKSSGGAPPIPNASPAVA